MKKQKVYIYGLSGCDNIIRYVGKTIKEPIIRKKEHISESKTRGFKTYKVNQINKLIKNNEDIKIHILEECNINNQEEKEKYQISKFDNLTNTAPGGLGGNNSSKFLLTYKEVKDYVNKNYPHVISEKKQRKLDNLPNFIPKRPDIVYKDKGWVSYGEFFNNTIISYNDLKKQVVDNNIKSIKEYKIKKTRNMPSDPSRYYKNDDWISYYDFFNKIKKNKNIKKKYFTYDNLKNILKPLYIKSKCEYIKQYKINKNTYLYKIPSNPKLFYKNKGQISYFDFFGNNFKHIQKKSKRKKKYPLFIIY